jgi:hypothetical protein
VGSLSGFAPSSPRRRRANRAPYGLLRAEQVALATNAFPSLLRRLRAYIVPVYDYVLMTESLTGEQMAAIPQLEGVRFTHTWGRMIDTCSRFTAFDT